MEHDVTGGTKRGKHKPTGNGNRLIILHAGGENGWIEGDDLVLQSKKSTGDCHDEMNSEQYEECDSMISYFLMYNLTVL